ncbi:MAG TPA: SDR family oxidoreductase [Acidimicrobiales bacterium]|nr:SDR family oxidoreductase [Acidimicrobiales bacterium]
MARPWAVVTGASSGIGAAYAARLAGDGWDLSIVARRRDRLDALAGRLTADHGVDVEVLAADLGSPGQLAQLVDEVERRGPDMLVNAAGLAYYMPFAQLPGDKARELVEVNVLAPVLLCRAALPSMRERGSGSIVNVASLLAFSGAVEAPFMPRRAVYAATKSFLVTYSEILAGEVRGDGVRVQVVCPGVVRSEFHSRQGLDLSDVPAMEPELVVEASLADLETGAVVSVPGLADLGLLGRVAEADSAMLGSTRATALPDRYRRTR